MAANKKLLVLPGDGIGPEVMREVRRVIDWMERRRSVSFDISEDLVGGASIDGRGESDSLGLDSLLAEQIGLLAAHLVGAGRDAAHPPVLQVLEVRAAAGDDAEGHVDCIHAFAAENGFPDLGAALGIEERFA